MKHHLENRWDMGYTAVYIFGTMSSCFEFFFSNDVMIDMFPPVVAGVWSQRRAAWLRTTPPTTTRRRSRSSFTISTVRWWHERSGRITVPLRTHIFGVVFCYKKTKAGGAFTCESIKNQNKARGGFTSSMFASKIFVQGDQSPAYNVSQANNCTHSFRNRIARQWPGGFKLQGEIGSNLIATKPPRSS